MSRWKVVGRVKRYPHTRPADLPSLWIIEPFELGEVVSEISTHWFKWAAESKALRMNMPPSMTWRAVVERAR